MEDVLKKNLTIDNDKYDFVGIGSQIIGYGTTKTAFDFIKVLPKASGKKTFIFRTAGGVVPTNYNASKPIIKKLTKKGKIRFRASCNSCMRCYYNCPKSAIKFKRLTFFTVVGGYNAKEIFNQSNPYKEKKEGKTPPFLEYYIKDNTL